MEDAPFLKTTARGQAFNDSTYFYMPYIILRPTYFSLFFFTRQSLRSKMKFFVFFCFLSVHGFARVSFMNLRRCDRWTTRRWRFAFFFRAFKENLINLSLFFCLLVFLSPLFLFLFILVREEIMNVCVNETSDRRQADRQAGGRAGRQTGRQAGEEYDYLSDRALLLIVSKDSIKM